MGTALVYAILAVCALGVVANLMPYLDFTTAYEMWSSVGMVLNYGFYFIPASTFIWCLSIIILVEQANLVWAGFNWILRRIPGQG